MIDVGPVNIKGAVTGTRVRVLWSDGTLYVVRSASNIQTFATAEPVLTSGVWRTETEAGQVSFTRRGCSGCGFRLHLIPKGDILAT